MPKQPSKNELLVIVDGNAIIHRAFHAIPPLQTKDGVLVNAVYGFISILTKTINDLKPAYVAVTFDRKEATFRHKAYDGYKATREKQVQEFYDQIPMAEEVLKVMKIPVYALNGFEADDVIATICEVTKKNKNLERIIVTGDQDTMQLVTEDTKVLTPGKGIKETVLYDVARVRERYGLDPEQMVDYKALRGDPSDNIPGVRGIGEKGASALIAAFGSIEKMYREIEKGTDLGKTVSERQRTALVAGKEDAMKAKELVTLVRNVPIPFELDDARLRTPDREALISALSNLDFKSLLPRVLEAFAHTGLEPVNVPPKKLKQKKSEFVLVSSAAQVTDLVKELKEREQFALRTFFDGSFLDKKLNGLAFAWDDAAYVVPPKHDWLKKFESVLADMSVQKTCHDLKSDLEILNQFGLELRGATFDTMLASYILNPGIRDHELEALVFNELGRELPGSQVSLLPTIEDLAPRFAAEASAVWDLTKILLERIKKEELVRILNEFELPLSPVLANMERHGVSIDMGFLGGLSETLGARIETLNHEICELAGEEFNVSSAQQLSKILFDKLKIHEKVRIRRTGSGARLSTAAGELEKLKSAHPIVPLILEYRELTKLTTTYVDALPKLVRPDTSRVHTSFNQAVTATGRLSSSNPNLQNIPLHSELGREIRKAFIASPGYALVVADYSQFELRILAHLSNDSAMIDAFRSGQDIHARTASEVWGVPIEEVTKDMRFRAKAINFGIAYGMGASSLSESAGISREEARSFIEKYFLTFRNVSDYLDETKALAYAQGYVQTLFGRKRYLPELKSELPYLRAAGERMAINAPIQGTNADAIKRAMIDLNRYIGERFGFERDAAVKMIIQVHDELVFEVKKELVTEFAEVVRDKMEHAIELSVPVKVDVRTGKNWGDLDSVK